VTDRSGFSWRVDAPLIWVALLGVWPLFDPGHAMNTLGSVVDIIMHSAAWVWLAIRWRVDIERRRWPT
jgi:hypothetical protein